MTDRYKVTKEWRESGRWYVVYRLIDPAAADTPSNRIVRYTTKDKCMAMRVAAAANREVAYGTA